MNWERITPLLPLAPKNAPFANAEETEATERLWSFGKVSSAACTAARMVKSMLVPVSPSGTGNTFSALMASRYSSRQLVASEKACLSSCPRSWSMLNPSSRFIGSVVWAYCGMQQALQGKFIRRLCDCWQLYLMPNSSTHGWNRVVRSSYSSQVTEVQH